MTETQTPTDARLGRLLELGTSTVYEGTGADWWVDPAIRPAWSGAKVVGPAYPVRAALGDNLALQRGVREAPAGSVLVVEAEGGAFGHWGGILTEIALLRGVLGLVIHGTVRDIDEVEGLGFPIFATGIAMRHAEKVDEGIIGEPIELAGRTVRVGDVVIADADGVVIVPSERVDEALSNGVARFEGERERIATIRSGEVPAMKVETPANG
ncbi:RraA family protein [Agrococcus sp. ARC_14]|uniref:RraA family protein n=1 Tax=Agrococcus sp. ARC_14 TaxID=2919927 RepID=UPI001F05E07C|nr:RraA family protein [Agrococcus sp. ARC_14]MCH1881902.1 RraA family protein [Agrococcus sp. ARC_14]